MIQLDPFQKDFISYQGNKILVAGRQTGKSEAQAYDNAEFSLNNPETTALIISKTERQSEELLLKVLDYLQTMAPGRVGKGKYKPTKHLVYITHKGKKPSRVMCLPVGLAGEGIRGYTIAKLTADEAQLISDDVFTAITPMLLTTNGFLSLSGTPQGKQGFFWEAYKNELGHFKVFHVSSLEVIENRPISATWKEYQRKSALDYLAREKARMTNNQFLQEYCGIFVEDLKNIFSDTIIKNTCVLKRPHEITTKRKTYGGSDIAGMGSDTTTFAIFHRNNAGNIEQIEQIVKSRIYPHETADLIIELNKKYNFVQYAIDDGGLGVGVLGLLLRDPKMSSRIVPLNNSRRALDYDGKKNIKLQKEEMYSNLLMLMEQNKIKLLDDDEIIASLKSMQYEIDEKGKVFIFGNNSHICEAIIRGAWITWEDKHLNLYVF